MRKEKIKFYASPFIMVGLIIMLVLMFAMWTFVFVLFLQGGNSINSREDLESGLITVSFVVASSILSFIFTCHKGFSVFEISEKGLKSSLFKVFRKTEIKWEEITEIRCYGLINKWIFFSKVSLENMSYDAIIKRKDTLQIEYSEQMVQLIRRYSNKEIINLPEKTLKTE